MSLSRQMIQKMNISLLPCVFIILMAIMAPLTNGECHGCDCSKYEQCTNANDDFCYNQKVMYERDGKDFCTHNFNEQHLQYAHNEKVQQCRRLCNIQPCECSNDDDDYCQNTQHVATTVHGYDFCTFTGNYDPHNETGGVRQALGERRRWNIVNACRKLCNLCDDTVTAGLKESNENLQADETEGPQDGGNSPGYQSHSRRKRHVENPFDEKNKRGLDSIAEGPLLRHDGGVPTEKFNRPSASFKGRQNAGYSPAHQSHSRRKRQVENRSDKKEVFDSLSSHGPLLGYDGGVPTEEYCQSCCQQKA